MTTQGPGWLAELEALLPTHMCTHHMLRPTLKGPWLSEVQELGSLIRREHVGLPPCLSTLRAPRPLLGCI